MKKMICLLLVCSLSLSCAWAFATEAVPADYPCTPADALLNEDDAIVYNDAAVQKGIETAMYGEGSVTNKKDVARYVQCVGIGFTKDSQELYNMTTLPYENAGALSGMEGNIPAGTVDLSALQFCTKLRVLAINSESVTGWEALSKLKNLKAIFIRTSKPFDLSYLSGLNKLTYVSFIDCQGFELAPLSTFKGLKDVYFGGCDEVDMLFSLDCKALSSFRFVNTPIKNLALLAVNTKLTALELVNTDDENRTKFDASDLNAVLLHASKLKQLSLTKVSMAGLDSLFDNRSITDLMFDQCADLSTDPEDWEQLSKIKSLVFCGCSLTDASFLKGMSKLAYLNLQYNQVKDISWMAELKSLKSADLSSNQITDASPLAQLKLKDGLWIMDNPIADTSVLDAMRENGIPVEY